MTVEACARIVARGDPDRFRALMALPLPDRLKLFPLYAFNIEVARAPWVTREPMIAEMRLQWWADVLSEIAGGLPVRRHEVTTPLAGVLAPPIATDLQTLVAARRADIERAPFADWSALEAYLDATGGVLMRAAGALLGARAAEADSLGDLGHAAGAAGWLRAVPDLQARGRVPLPDPSPEGLAAFARRAREKERKARRQLSSRAARRAALTAWLAAPVLEAAARRPARVAEGSLAPSPFRARLRLLRMGLLL